MHYVIVSTASSILLVDISTRTIIPIESDRTEYYGVSWFPDGNDLVLSHSGVDHQTLIDVSSYAQSEVGWISAGERSSDVFLSAPHQILCLPDGRIACTNTGRNAISIIDLDKPGLFQESRISPSRWDRLSIDSVPGDHLNSVYAKEDRLYVIAHRFTKGAALATLSLPEGRILDVRSVGNVSGLHNIWVTDDGRKISCHSETGSLIDLENNKVLWEAGAPIYTRGLAASADYVFVGESRKVARASRRHSMSGLWVLDRRTWQTYDYFCLGPYGTVHEVRLLDEPDEAHHGHVFKGLDELLKKDMRREIEFQQLERARIVRTSRQFRQGYTIVFGTPEFLENGTLRADAENLCLAIRSDSNQSGFEFEYALMPEKSASHVSVVVDYRGSGGDARMAAVLLQSSGGEAALSIWHQDGSSWALSSAPGIGSLPLAGRVMVKATADKIALSFNDGTVFSATAETLGVARCDEGLGIRWIGADIKPDAFEAAHSPQKAS